MLWPLANHAGACSSPQSRKPRQFTATKSIPNQNARMHLLPGPHCLYAHTGLVSLGTHPTGVGVEPIAPCRLLLRCSPFFVVRPLEIWTFPEGEMSCDRLCCLKLFDFVFPCYFMTCILGLHIAAAACLSCLSPRHLHTPVVP